ncbi:MAG: VCBS repeat-containing protein [Flavobacteriales bacterium]
MRLILTAVLIISIIGCFSSCTSEKKKTLLRQKSEPLFTLLTKEETGISFRNKVVETDSNNYFTNQYIYNGGGVAVGDLNNDGLEDLYFTGNHTDDRIYLNLGDLKFQDVTLSCGIHTGHESWSSGVSFVDLNADGWLDIYVCKAGHNKSSENRRNQLYMNKGDGTFFLDKKSALSDPGLSTQASFFDFDLDGDLDVYVMNYPETFNADHVRKKHDEKANWASSDNLYRNDGKGSFKKITEKSGIGNYAFGLGLITADFNGDFYPDIYVANDYMENDYLYINKGDGTFSDEIKKRTGHNSQSSMGIDRADINNDGFEDFFIAEMLPSDYKRSKENMASMDIESFWYFISQGHHYQYMHNVLQVDNHTGYFSDVSQMAGVSKTDWSWSPILEDLDNDGKVDLFVTNGVKRDMLNKDAKAQRKLLEKKKGQLSAAELYNSIPSTKLSNYAYRNNGDFSFQELTNLWGLDQPTFSNGATAADLDNDGDLELIINNLEQEAFIYKNNSSEKGQNSYLKVKLEWPRSPNVNGLNSKVEVYSKGTVFSREVLQTAGYQSGRSAVVHFGLGELSRVDSARVIWPTGAVQTIEIEELNKYYTVVYNPSYTITPKSEKKYFEEIDPGSLGLTFTHKENVCYDFKSEILLPHKQSTLGPSLEVGDINGDGLDDLFIGGASGQDAALFIQSDQGKFTQTNISGRKEWENLDAAIFDADNDGDGDLYLVNGGGEEGIAKRDMYYVNKGSNGLAEHPRGIPEINWPNGSCIVHADFDGNGFQDVFVAGGAKPGTYPLADSSYFLLNEGGSFTSPESPWIADLPDAGFITSAVSTDFNQDGKPDLVIAGEWMPVSFYQNTGSSFKNVTASLGIEEEIGWWYSLKAADINQDGIEDIIAGNMGKNHKFRPSRDKPFMIYYDDYDENGSGDIVLANTYADGTCLPVRGKQCMSEQMPFISNEKVRDYGEFANSDLMNLLGKNPEESKVALAATEFSSSLFLSQRLGRFKREELPAMAQVGPVNGVCVFDVNNDGKLDILTAGNKYNTEVETTRADASVGCLLLSGETTVYNSGFFTRGNVKDIELLKTATETFVLVANNNSKMQVFRVLD